MRERADRSRAAALEDEVIRLRVLARRLWHALHARTGLEAEALFDGEDLRIANRALDAALTVWDRQRITIVPIRTILDPGGALAASHSWPTQGEGYLGRWPDGSTRNLTRAQLLMMAGFDPDEGSSDEPPDPEVPF